MNLIKSFKVTTVWATTQATLGTTGVAITVSTAGSSAGDSTTKGGFPFPSTAIDMQGYDGVVFIASVSGTSGGNAILKAAWSALSSTDGSSNFTDYPTAHVQSSATDNPSTVYDKLVLEVVRPVKRYIQAVVQLAATSEVLHDITAIQYGAGKQPVTGTSTAYTVGGSVVAIGTT